MTAVKNLEHNCSPFSTAVGLTFRFWTAAILGEGEKLQLCLRFFTAASATLQLLILGGVGGLAAVENLKSQDIENEQL